MALSRKQKDDLAWIVLLAMGDLAEQAAIGGIGSGELDDVNPEDVREQIATWARRLPGDKWDTRLGAVAC